MLRNRYSNQSLDAPPSGNAVLVDIPAMDHPPSPAQTPSSDIPKATTCIEHMCHLTEIQSIALSTLSARAPPTFPSDDPYLLPCSLPSPSPSNPPTDARTLFLLRLLSARNFDVDAAEKLLHSVLRWRRMNMPWTITSKEAMAPEASFHVFDTGATDIQGRPVLYALQRSIRTRILDIEQFRKATIYFLESIVMRLACSFPNQFVIIYDFDGYSILQNSSLSAAQAMFAILQEAYPDSLAVAYALPNYPRAFYTVFKIAKGFIDSHTAAKIQFMSPNNYKEELAEHLGKAALPIWLGGSNDSFSLPTGSR